MGSQVYTATNEYRTGRVWVTDESGNPVARFNPKHKPEIAFSSQVLEPTFEPEPQKQGYSDWVSFLVEVRSNWGVYIPIDAIDIDLLEG